MSQHAPSIANYDQYRAAVKQMDKGKKPAFLLRLLMNALESYRQSRKMGWSRPQNKYGLTVFESFRLDPTKDQVLIDFAIETILKEFAELDPESSQFVRDLREDPRLMGFIFVHDSQDEGKRYEGVTFSFGRVASGQTRNRDRLDLIVESEITDGTSQGLSRVRAYVDPFKTPIRKNPALVLSHESPQTNDVEELFVKGSELYSCWLGDADRDWQHWTQRYINYFGPRTTPVSNTYFPTVVDLPAMVPQNVDNGQSVHTTGA